MLFDKKNICVIYFIKKHRISAKLNPWVCTEKNLNDMSILEGALRENCPNTGFFLVRIFPHLDWIRIFKEQTFLFSPNAGKYGPEKNPYLDTFHAVVTFLWYKWRHLFMEEHYEKEIFERNGINFKRTKQSGYTRINYFQGFMVF